MASVQPDPGADTEHRRPDKSYQNLFGNMQSWCEQVCLGERLESLCRMVIEILCSSTRCPNCCHTLNTPIHTDRQKRNGEQEKQETKPEPQHLL